MRVIVCGLGYVGVTTAACLAKQGHELFGIDVAAAKVDAIEQGRSPIVEPGVAELIAAARAAGHLRAAASLEGLIEEADAALICVGTPSAANGSLDLQQVVSAARDLGRHLQKRDPSKPPLACVFRSTMLPGSMERVVRPALEEAAGEAPGQRYDLVFNPEFLREGTAIADYFGPPKIVIGERAPGAGDVLKHLYAEIEAPLFLTDFATAELVKYVDNAYHATKVAFANEVGRLALDVGADPQEVARLFLADTKLNVSPAYLRPGGAFGGSCLPKDVRALVAAMRDRGIATDLLASLMPSNAAHKEFLAKRVLDALPPTKRVLMLGLTFKADTDDLRESHLLDLAERLLGAGCDLEIHDPDLVADQLFGQNLAHVKKHLPHLASLLVSDPVAAAERADIAVLGKAMPGVVEKVARHASILNIHRL